MKRILYILGFFLTFTTAVFAQDAEQPGDRIQERMNEYIQKRLNLSKSEAERFSPVFLNYFKELRQTNQQYRGDRLVLQQKIVDLRLRYRDQFKPIMGEKRSNDVFNYEHDFVEELKRLRQDRMQNKFDKAPGRRGGGLLP
ncbi:hypothetical protein [Flavisolibacter tropicus]|uniref:Uncharacterized protein n=1 Tax=Flavisolibacter tropicus TaxID=1492898 RepID=A0A172TZT5_9BACT|nr:hypothetical protein [Flavisolibacter tropicus]ANE52247.1 hypothetical protein SY85_18910 [Flavisolibacter tropicus]